MEQITLTLDLTPETLEILKLLTNASSSNTGDAMPEYEQLSFDDLEATKEATKDKKPARKTAAKDKKAAAPKEAPATDEDDKPEISLTDVRAVALKLSKAGKQKELKEIFAKYGADKLSGISADNYGDLMADLEAANE